MWYGTNMYQKHTLSKEYVNFNYLPPQKNGISVVKHILVPLTGPVQVYLVLTLPIIFCRIPPVDHRSLSDQVH